MPAYLLNICRSISDRDAVDEYWRRASATYSGKASINGGSMKLSGCVLGGLICQSQTWTKM